MGVRVKMIPTIKGGSRARLKENHEPPPALPSRSEQAKETLVFLVLP